jgi:hypothetical protein
VGVAVEGLAEGDVVPLPGAREGETPHFPDAAVGLGVAPRRQGEQGELFPGVGAVEVVPLLGAGVELNGGK